MPHIADMDFQMSPYNAETVVLDAEDGRVIARPYRAKVAIIGAGQGKAYAPYREDEWEVWGLNAVPTTDHLGMLRCDRWFEMHTIAAQNQKDMTWIRRCPVPLYMVPSATTQWALNEFNPQQVRYPLERIEKHFGVSYFACSFAYQMALAIHEKFEEIGLFGVELCYGTERERSVEWANVSWWLGVAQGLGVKIHLPPGSHLGRHDFRYGIEYDQEKTAVERYVALMRKVDAQRQTEEGVGG
jgi:hypothetical protein